MRGMLDWQFSARGAYGRAHFEVGKDVYVIFAGEEKGRIPASELAEIMRENTPLDGRATKLLERIQALMQGEIAGSDIANGLGRIERWIANNVI
jgi:hypothetical protein